MKFTEKLRTTVADYTAKIKAKDAEITDHQKNGINTYSDAKYKEIALDLNEQRTLLMSEAVRAAQTIVDEYKAELPKHFVASGVELNAEDMALLNSGYKLTVTDLEAMFDRYAPMTSPHNHTMLRAIMDYCETHGVNIARNYIGEAAKANAADDLMGWAKSCYQRPEYGMESEAYFAEILPVALAND